MDREAWRATVHGAAKSRTQVLLIQKHKTEGKNLRESKMKTGKGVGKVF